MEHEKKRNGSRGLLIFSGIFLAGFLAGVLLPNILWKLQLPQVRSTIVYLLSALDREVPGRAEFFNEIWRIRGAYGILWLLTGFSIFGIPFSVVTIMWMGFSTGALLTLYVLQFGLLGGVLGLATLLPHFVIYLPVSIMSASVISSASVYSWQKQTFSGINLRKYGIFTIFFLILQSLGMFLESYINPLILQFLLSRWNFF